MNLQKKSWKNKHVDFKETNGFNFERNKFLIQGVKEFKNYVRESQ